MAGITKLELLLQNIAPVLATEEFVFCVIEEGSYGDLRELNPVGSFLEDEGLTLILEKSVAAKNGLFFECVFRKITLQVHSSLEAVGLTGRVAAALTERGISANVVAAHYHDHIFVPADRAQEALQALSLLSEQRQ